MALPIYQVVSKLVISIHCSHIGYRLCLKELSLRRKLFTSLATFVTELGFVVIIFSDYCFL